MSAGEFVKKNREALKRLIRAINPNVGELTDEVLEGYVMNHDGLYSWYEESKNWKGVQA